MAEKKRGTDDRTSIDLLLSEVCRAHHTRVRATFQSLGLHQGQPRLLWVLWDKEGRTHTELAAKLHVQPATITKMVQRMERAGFLQRRSDPDDERVSRVYLSDAGRGIRVEVQNRLRDIDALAMKSFTQRERQALAAMLTRVRDNLGEENR